MEGTLNIAMKMLKNVFLNYLEHIVGSTEFRYRFGVLRRIWRQQTSRCCPELLTIMTGSVKDDDLWGITYIQIQWIAPSLKDELFPEEEFLTFKFYNHNPTS